MFMVFCAFHIRIDEKNYLIGEGRGITYTVKFNSFKISVIHLIYLGKETADGFNSSGIGI